MSLTDAAGNAVSRFVGRLFRRAAGWFLVVIFVLAAIYQATTAISLALELEFGVVKAHLIIAAFYAVATAVIVGVLFATSKSSPKARAVKAADGNPEFQLATIVEAMLLGFSLSRRK
ncbi:MAG: hypothetical protein QOJ96_491 [Alphaproteobacteria bacterium]|jgi:uncharacterized integral membrane protein|nr:hypothetical protein [Alphaproteobacteria bacterium]